MRSYNFDYIDGSSRPRGTITAKDHGDFYKLLKEFLRNKEVSLCPSTIHYQEADSVPDPITYNSSGLAPGEYDLAAARRAGLSVLEG